MCCLRSALPPTPLDLSSFPAVDLSGILQVYHDLGEVFSKQQALSLPPHGPYAIDLRPDAPLPSSRFEHLSRLEHEGMENYIRESLASGLIATSSSPVGVRFFFMKTKDGTLRPCIGIMVRNKYPLPQLDAVFARLENTQIFTKLDLRNAYHLIRIRSDDEWKTPIGQCLLMPFGLTNAPTVFQALVDVLHDMLNKFLFVYLDDILIF